MPVIIDMRGKGRRAGPCAGAAAGAAKPPAPAPALRRYHTPESLPCIYRGELKRYEGCQFCGQQDRREAVYACSAWGECSIYPFKNITAGDLRPEPCTDCTARIAGAVRMSAERINADPLQIQDRAGRETHALRDEWRNTAGFLVCGGPSLKELPLDKLKDRGIVSMGLNNSSGRFHCRAMTFCDPQSKIHHGIFFDPTIRKFVPTTKFNKRVRVKHPDGSFQITDIKVRDCPNVYAYKRIGFYTPETFLTENGATWGNSDDGVALTGRPKIIFSMFIGIRLLHYLGCRRIYLLGADFSMDDKRGYAFEQGRDSGAIRSNNDHYRLAAVMFKELRPYLENVGLEIYNCNPESRLAAFDYVPFDRAYQDCRGLVPPEPFDLSGWYEKSEEEKRKEAEKAAGRGARHEAWLDRKPGRRAKWEAEQAEKAGKTAT